MIYISYRISYHHIKFWKDTLNLLLNITTGTIIYMIIKVLKTKHSYVIILSFLPWAVHTWIINFD